jgi:hypothetical protein
MTPQSVNTPKKAVKLLWPSVRDFYNRVYKDLEITPQSAKNKGRKLQQWVKNTLLLLAPELDEDDIRSTSMGNGGEDVQLSPAARKLFPIQIECKNKAKYAVYKDYAQAKEHGNHTPVLIIKQNNSQPLAVVDAKWFFEYMKAHENNKSN